MVRAADSLAALATLAGAGVLSAAAWSPDGALLAGAVRGQAGAAVWAAHDGARVATVHDAAPVTRLLFAPDSTHLLLCVVFVAD